MRLSTILVLLSMLLGLGAAGSGDRMGNGRYYNLGVSLSSGYGTISAHMLPYSSYSSHTLKRYKFTNSQNPKNEYETNHFIDIAKIEGGGEYKNYMLGLQNEKKTSLAPRFCPFSTRICQYWPIKIEQPVNPLAPMLKALIAAAEATLETKIGSVAVTAYDLKTLNFDIAHRDVQSALEELGVEGHDYLGHSSAAAIRSLGIQDWVSCEPWQYTPPGHPKFRKHVEQVILTVDYTRNSLATVLWTEECQVLTQRSWTNSTKLGHDALIASRNIEAGKQRFEKNLESALEYVCKRPRRREPQILEGVVVQQTGVGPLLVDENLGGMMVHENISAVLLMGENGYDADMNAILRKVLAKQFANGGSVDLLQAQEISPDPTFTGSRAAAWSEGDVLGERELDSWRKKPVRCSWIFQTCL